MTAATMCSARGCNRTITGRTVVVDRDGRTFCKHCGDRLPPYLRRVRTTRKATP